MIQWTSESIFHTFALIVLHVNIYASKFATNMFSFVRICIQAADGTDATARAKLFQARHGGPDSNDGVSSNHNYSDILLAAHHSMDLDSDGRLHLFEAAMWTRAANVVLEELIAQAASNEFQQLGLFNTKQLILDWWNQQVIHTVSFVLARGQSFITLHSIQQAGILSQLSENALYQFYAALDSDKDTRYLQQLNVVFMYTPLFYKNKQTN